MARYRMVGGELVALTTEEEAARDDEEAVAAVAATDAAAKVYVRERISDLGVQIGEHDDWNETVYWVLRALVQAVKFNNMTPLDNLLARIQDAETNHPKP